MERLVINYFDDDDPFGDEFSDSNTTNSLYTPDLSIKTEDSTPNNSTTNNEDTNLPNGTTSTEINTINKPKLIFRCEKCEFSTKTRFSLARHQVEHEAVKPNKNKICFQCDVCEFSTNIRFALVRHQMTHQEANSESDNDEYYSFSDINDELGNIFNESDGEASNIKKIDTKPQIFSCQKCKFSTKSRFSLKQHEKTHLTINFKCSHCTFEGKSEKSLFFHLLNAHKDITTFCNYCERKTPNYNEHVEKCKRKATFQCKKCKTYKTTKKNLLKHLNDCKTASVIEEQTSNNEKYNCNICSIFITADKKLFNEHLIMHIQPKNEIIKQQPKESVSNKTSEEMRVESQTVLNESTDESRFILNELDDESNQLQPAHDEPILIKEESLDKAEQPKTELNEREIYNCALCSYNTKVSKLITSHIFGHKLNKPMYKCSYCDFKSFKRLVSMHAIKVHKKHNQWHHTQIKCQYCSFICKNKGSYKEHTRRHTLLKERICKCKHCDFKSFKINVIKHQNKIHNESGLLMPCNFCSFRTIYKDSLKRHMEVHSKKKVIYSCKKCDFKTLISNKLRAHINKIHGVINKKTYKCALCSFKSNKKYKLARHKNCHEYLSTYKCHYCDFKGFASPVARHSIKIHNEKFNVKVKRVKKIKFQAKIKIEKSETLTHALFQCDLCSYKSKHKHNLQNHLEKHRTKIPVIKCPDCDFKGFKYSLGKHLRKVHNKEIKLKKDHVYTCELCSFTANWLSQFKNHYLLHTVYNRPVYSCTDCTYKGFKVNIIKHSREVHGKKIDMKYGLKIKSFNCSYCSYSINNSDTFQRHLLLHTEFKEPIYQCEYCDYKATLALIRCHSSKAHNIKFRGMELPIYNCEYCNFKGRLTDIKRHCFNEHKKNFKVKKLNNAKTIYKCTKCSYTTPSCNIYKTHIEKHNDSGQVVIKCPYCDFKGFKTTVGKHVKAKHDVLFKCDKCSYSTEDNRKFSNHKGLHNNETLMYKCSICDYKSVSLEIRRHMIKEHPNRNKEQNILRLVEDCFKSKEGCGEKENVDRNN